MVLEILSVEPIYPQYSGVLETCLALRYWFFEVLGSESVKQASKNAVISLNFRCLSPIFDHLIPYVNERKSLRRVSGQNRLFCHRFRSSQRW